MKTKFYLLFIYTCLSQVVMAQIIDEKKYLARVKEVDAEIMGNNVSFFASNHVPEKYNNASAVILAKKIDILATKSSTGYTNLLTIREKVKIQDRHALQEYSEFSFTRISKQSNFYEKAAYTYLGISVIKPDGTIKKIDISQEAVQDQNEDGKEKFKVAIPGLQVGDILDFYSRVEKKFTTAIPQLDLVLAGEYPIVKFGVSTKIWKDFAVIYSVDNGAPNPTQSTEGDFIHFNMQMVDIPKSPDDLWVYNKRELPVFKLNIIPADSKSKEKDYVLQKGKVLNGIPQSWVDQQLSSQLIDQFRVDISEELLKQAQKNITQLKNTKWKQYNKDSIINYLYYYGRFAFLYDYMRDDKIQIGMERNGSKLDYRFYGFFISGLKAYDIDFDFIVTVPRHAGKLNSIVSMEDFHYLLKAKGNKDYFIFPPTIYSTINTFPYAFEGQQAYVYNGIFNKKKGASVETTLPTSQASLNQSKEHLKISIDKANPWAIEYCENQNINGTSGL